MEPKGYLPDGLGEQARRAQRGLHDFAQLGLLGGAGLADVAVRLDLEAGGANLRA